MHVQQIRVDLQLPDGSTLPSVVSVGYDPKLIAEEVADAKPGQRLGFVRVTVHWSTVADARRRYQLDAMPELRPFAESA